MNRKHFLFVLLALAIIGGAGLVLLRHNKEAWSVREAKMGDPVLPGFKPNDVAAIHVKGASDIHIAQANGVWRVRERENYPANYQQIKNCLIKLRDLKVVQAEEVGPSQLARVELDEPGKETGGATLIEFNDAKGKLLSSLRVGKRHLRPQDPSVPAGLHGLYDGRYVLLPSDPGSVLLISDELAGVSSEPESWLDHEFFKVDHVRAVALTSTNAADSWSISRDTESAAWTLADFQADKGEALSISVVSQIGELVPFIAFMDVVPKTSASEKYFKNSKLLKIETFDHFTYNIKVSPKLSDGNYLIAFAVTAEKAGQSKENLAKLEKESSIAAAPWDYVVEARIMDLLVRDRAQLIEKKAVASDQVGDINSRPLSLGR
jgi:hypothetical protein